MPRGTQGSPLGAARRRGKIHHVQRVAEKLREVQRDSQETEQGGEAKEAGEE